MSSPAQGVVRRSPRRGISLRQAEGIESRRWLRAAELAAVQLFSVVFLLATYQGGDVHGMLVCFSFQTLAIVFVTSRHAGLLHPLIFFPLFLYPYSTWFTYYSLAQNSIDRTLLAESLWFAGLGLAVYAGVVTLILGVPGRQLAKNAEGSSGRSPTQRMAYVLARWGSLLAASAFCLLLGSGSGSKQAVLSHGGVLFALATFSAWVAVASTLIVFACSKKAGKGSLNVMPYAVGMGLLAMLTVGERDHLFRLVVGMVLIGSADWRRTSLTFCAGVLGGAPALIYLSSFAKAYLIQGGRESAPDFLSMFFSNEFIASGRNLYAVLLHGTTFSWDFLRNDVIRGLTPFGNAFGLFSATGWFHTVYREDNNFAGSAGWGLGYTTEGYICGGAVGIAVIYACVGALVAFGYRCQSQSPYWLAFYALLCTSAVYCMRADLASLLSMTFKIGGTAILVPYIVSRFDSPGNRSAVRAGELLS